MSAPQEPPRHRSQVRDRCAWLDRRAVLGMVGAAFGPEIAVGAATRTQDGEAASLLRRCDPKVPLLRFAIPSSRQKRIADEICDAVGLPRNFDVVRYWNASAGASTGLQGGHRIILLDPNLIKAAAGAGMGDWPFAYLLAHEIGHHLCGHVSLCPTASGRQAAKELEADHFAGFALGRLGAPLVDAIGYLSHARHLARTRPDWPFGPVEDGRVESVTAGWNKANRSCRGGG